MTGGGEPIWKNGRMLGYLAEVSTSSIHIDQGQRIGTCSAIVFADWRQMLVAEFSGAVEIVTDVYSLMKTGMVD